MGLIVIRNKILNILLDPGVGFALGNALIFWGTGDIGQLITISALIFSLFARSYSEFNHINIKLLSFLKDDMLAMRITGIALYGIALSAFQQGEMLSAVIALCFGTGNLCIANSFELIQKYLFNNRSKKEHVFGNLFARPELYITAGLGILSYSTGGMLGIFTWVVTAVGGGIAIRNALYKLEQTNNNPMLYFALGTAATAMTGLLHGNPVQAIANICFSNSYITINKLQGGTSLYIYLFNWVNKIIKPVT